METKKDYLNRIYNLARAKGLCKTQGEFAHLLAMNPGTISKALQGDEKYCTDRIARRVRIWAEQIGIEGDKPIKAMDPDIVIPAATLEMYTAMAKSIDRLTALVERLQQITCNSTE